MTVKEKPHTEPPPIEGYIKTLITNFGSESTNHQKIHNSEPSDMGEFEKATESERNPNSNPDDYSESESELESADEYESAADEPAAEKPGADGEHHSSPSARRKRRVRVRAAVENIQKQSIFTGVTTVVLIGNPGVGKSTLLNILGGNFESGFSLVGGLTKDVTTADVTLQGRQLRLVDMPGINETALETTEANLKLLQEQLNNGGSYVLFFVISPRNGRVGESDFGLISFVLRKLQKGPTVGLIITQIPNDQIEKVQDPKYASAVVQVLKNGKAKTALLEQKNMLALPYLGIFNDEEKQNVIDYVLSFEPKQVKIRRLAIDTFEKFKVFFKNMFEGKSMPKTKKKVSTERRGPQAI
jgi:GTP-binding protein EngB required for normal cell division